MEKQSVKYTVKILRIASLTYASFFMSSVALAADLPRYDVEKHCSRVASISGSSAMIKNGCMDMEQEAYDKLKPLWASIPGKTQQHCGQVAKVSGGSYSILEGCIDMETEEAAKPRQFKY